MILWTIFLAKTMEVIWNWIVTLIIKGNRIKLSQKVKIITINIASPN